MHRKGTAGPQRRRRLGKCGPGGDDVVDQQHAAPGHAWRSGFEDRAYPTSGGIEAGLMAGTDPAQGRRGRYTKDACDRPSQDLGLIEAAVAHPHRGGGCPRDEIDGRGHGGQRPGAERDDVTPIAVLERQHHRTGCVVVAIAGAD